MSIPHPVLYLLRHGQSTWNHESRIQGQIDVPLNDQGRAQAAAQGRILSGLGLPPDTPVLASPLIRAAETARITCDIAGLRPVFDPRLVELGFGAWEGQLKSDLLAQMPGLAGRSLSDAAMDGVGESHVSLRARCMAVLDGLTGPTVIVSHGVFLAMLRGILRGLDRAAIARLPRPQGVVLRLEQGQEHVIGPVASPSQGPCIHPPRHGKPHASG